jgi:putative peptidoglycan lipid II flippase
MIPCTLAMLVLAPTGLQLLYGYGGISGDALVETIRCLRGYALGLLPMSYTLILASSFYAKRNYSWPMRCSLYSVICNICLNAFFVFILHWGAASIALATSLSAYLNCTLLMKELSREVKELFLWQKVQGIFLCSVAGVIVVTGVDSLWTTQSDFLSQLGHFSLLSTVYALSVFGFARIFKVKNLFVGLLRRLDF